MRIPPAFLALLFAGCAVGPDYQRPPADAPAAFGESGPWKIAAPKDDLPRKGWWRIFNDPVLDGLETRAEKANFNLSAALSRVDEARAVARISRADLFPAIALEPSVARDRYSGNRPVQPGATNPAYTANSITLPVDLSYEIDLFGRARRALESAQALAEAGAAAYQGVLLSLQAEVAQDYFTMRALSAEQAYLASTIEGRRQELALARARRAGGASGDLDVYRAETELATVESSALAVDQRIAELRHALAVLVGTAPESFSIEAAPLDSDPPAVPAGVPSELLERRPDVAQSERTLAAVNAQVGFAKSAFFPAIGLTAAAGYNSSAFDTLLHWNSREASVVPFASLPIFEGGANLANYQRSKAAYEEARALYRQQVLAALRDVEDGLSDLRYLASQAAVVDEGVVASRKAAELSRLRYLQGAADYFEVIDAERTTLEYEIQATQLRSARFEASILLVKALGGGW
jgi:multidrug efflux system outer membrane protein